MYLAIIICHWVTHKKYSETIIRTIIINILLNISLHFLKMMESRDNSCCYHVVSQLILMRKGKLGQVRHCKHGHRGSLTRRLRHCSSKGINTPPFPQQYRTFGGGVGGDRGRQAMHSRIRMVLGRCLPVGLAWGMMAQLGDGPHRKLKKSWKVNQFEETPG